jgi:hypothetical protein
VPASDSASRAGAAGRAVRSALASSAVSTVALRVADRCALERLPGWRRSNYRGQSVTLAGGSAAALGALAGAALEPKGIRGPAVLAGAAAAIAGAYDDLLAPRAEVAGDKGLAGHLAAARAGRVSGGVVKVVVIGGSALVAAGRLAGAGEPGGRRSGRFADRVVRAVVIAGSANLLNLLDLRPGRAAKVALSAGLVTSRGTAAGVAAASAGAAGAIMPGDLHERTMLGDLGANTVGALVGVRLAAGSARTRVGAAAVICALTAASERVSFSQVIDSTRVLHRVDQLGRR